MKSEIQIKKQLLDEQESMSKIDSLLRRYSKIDNPSKDDISKENKLFEMAQEHIQRINTLKWVLE